MNRTLEYYEHNARPVARRYEGMGFRSAIDRLARMVRPDARVLELGCGSGRDAAYLLSLGVNVEATDGSTAMLEQANELHPELLGRTTQLVLPGVLPYPDGHFDAVMTWAMLMHLSAEDIPDVIREIARVTSSGGVLAYAVTTSRRGLSQSGDDPDGRHFTCFSVAEWERIHTAAGYVTVDSEERDDLSGRPGIRWATFFARK